MGMKDQIVSLARDGLTDFIANVKGQAPSELDLEDLQWAMETVFAAGFLSIGGNTPERQAEIDQQVLEANSVLKDYAVARRIDGRTIVEGTLRKMLTKAGEILVSVGLRGLTGGVA